MSPSRSSASTITPSGVSLATASLTSAPFRVVQMDYTIPTTRPERGSIRRTSAYPDVMISRDLAIALKEAGLRWHPESGDRFQLDLPSDVEPEVEADIFTVSEMTIESRRTPSGAGILAFNGTTEWALDAVSIEEAIWLPGEEQLRELLR